MTKESYLRIALAICAVAVPVLVWVNYVDLGRNGEEHPNPKVNDGLTSLTGFDVAYPETGTSAKGTVFVMQGSDSLHVKIVADIIVGGADNSGALFYFTPELRVTEVLSSYRGHTGQEHVSVWLSSRLDREYNSWVEVGGHHSWWPYSGWGRVIIDLQLSGYATLDEIDSLYFTVAVGGKDNVIGIVGEKVTIPLLQNSVPKKLQEE